MTLSGRINRFDEYIIQNNITTKIKIWTEGIYFRKLYYILELVYHQLWIQMIV